MEIEFNAGFAPGAPVPSGGRVRIPSLLFVAGEYPDKGVTVTIADLDSLITRFQAAGSPVPVKAEHFDSPLDPLGEVVALHREGDNLFGMLVFSEGVASHIQERAARNLSVALMRDETGYSLKEVSLVFTGRVPGAKLLTPEQIQRKLADFRAAGKVTPAMEPSVTRLLSATPSVVTFADGSAVEIDIAAEIGQLLSALPILAPSGGQVPAIVAAWNAGSSAGSAPAIPSPISQGNPPSEYLNLAAKLGLSAEKATAQFKAEKNK